MKKILFLIIITFFIINCNNSNKSQNNNNNNKARELSFETKEFSRKSTMPNVPVTDISASIPVAQGNSNAAKNINDKVFEIVRLIVWQEDTNSSNYDDLFAGFVKNYEEFVTSYPDYTGNWEATIEGSVSYESTEVINIKLISYTMTGGAHGNSNTTSLLFDPKDGRELNIADIVSDTSALTAIAEEKFRGKYNIPSGQPINSTGLMFVNNSFELPQNIFITKQGLLLFYNAYEIAAYVEGTKDILISYDEINDILLLKDI